MNQNPNCIAAELEQVMRIYGTTVYRLAYAQLRSTADAEDVYQEVFLRYFRKRPQFDSEEHRKAWLLRVTLNRARSFLSSAWRRHTVPLESQISFPEPESRQLDEALARLRPGDRSLLHLFYFEELSVREMAQLLNRKESTVRTQLTRARNALKTIVKGEDYYERSI